MTTRRPQGGLLVGVAIAFAVPALALDPASASGSAPQPATSGVSPPDQSAAYCAGDYADDLAVLSPTARAFEIAQPQYTFCIRTTAVYECPFYGADGSLRRRRRTVTAHGTGFVIRRDGADSLVVTNEHVAQWPAVTDGDHRVEGVPEGCKRVSDSLRIVDDEADTYERDDIPLLRVVVDPQLDVAVLRAKAALPVLPWKIGHSAALRERNAVDVRGFPLGVIRTTNVGKVTSAYQHDHEREWDHDDFVVDAQLSSGNSGSPVFAVSCRTRELELVGIFHAGYDGSALNVVIGIDQVRSFLDTLKRAPRRAADPSALDATARQRIATSLAGAYEPVYPFGPTAAAVRARADGALLFEILPRQFPVRTQPVLVLEDLPSAAQSDFGRLGRIWAGDGRNLRLVDRAELDSEALGSLDRVLDALRRDADLVARLRVVEASAASTRERFDEAGRRESAVSRIPAVRAEIAQWALDLAEHLTPADRELQSSLIDAMAVPTTAAMAPTPFTAAHGGAQVEEALRAPALRERR
jgi:serine protease Do